jgi:DNA polymerase-4
VVSDYTGFVEQASIDELYADVTKVCNVRNPKFKYLNPKQIINSKSEILNPRWLDPFEEAVEIALVIKQRMKKEVGDYLTCSIGIADNKLVAKIASDMQKPDGIVIVASGKLQVTRGNSRVLWLSKDDLYHRLKLTDIPGIARRQEKNLNKLGIRTLADLRDCPAAKLVAHFGINGYHLHKMGQLEGSWKPEVEQDNKIKSIGHMYTLPMEYSEQKFFVPVLYKLCEMVAKRLRKQGLAGNIVHFYIRDKDYESFGQSLKLDFYIYDGREIFLQCLDIFNRLNKPAGSTEIKLIGVTVAGLRPYVKQLSLFGSEERLRNITAALDKVNAKYGDFTLCRVPVLAAGKVFRDSIGFGRIKEK